MGYVWVMFGICLGSVCDMLGTCLGYVWDMFGRCLGYVWDMFGTCLGDVWDIPLHPLSAIAGGLGAARPLIFLFQGVPFWFLNQAALEEFLQSRSRNHFVISSVRPSVLIPSNPLVILWIFGVGR